MCKAEWSKNYHVHERAVKISWSVYLDMMLKITHDNNHYLPLNIAQQPLRKCLNPSSNGDSNPKDTRSNLLPMIPLSCQPIIRLGGVDCSMSTRSQQWQRDTTLVSSLLRLTAG